MLITVPPPAATMWGKPCLQKNIVPSRFSSMVLRHAAILRQGLFNRSHHLIFLGDITHNAQRVTAFALNLTHRVGDGIGGKIGNDHFAAMLGEQPRGFAADARASTRDERYAMDEFF